MTSTTRISSAARPPARCPTESFNEMLNAKFYNLIMYGADMKDCEKIANYLIDNYTVKNLVLNVYSGQWPDLR